ncbi:MAG: hypothetical protein AAFX99_20755, partial [Myxococcota bacterium]
VYPSRMVHLCQLTLPSTQTGTDKPPLNRPGADRDNYRLHHAHTNPFSAAAVSCCPSELSQSPPVISPSHFMAVGVSQM